MLILHPCLTLFYFNSELSYITNESALRFAWSFSIIGLVVEFVVAIDEARVRFTDDAHLFFGFCGIHRPDSSLWSKKKNT